MICLKCGGTGVSFDGDICECQKDKVIELPLILEIPEQYQQVSFERSFLPKWLQTSYASVLEGILSEVKVNKRININYLICAPLNSGKTVFAYTLFATLHKFGVPMAKVMDLNEVRRLMNDIYNSENVNYELLSKSPVAVIKVPMDVPSRYGETMSTILDLRARNNGRTIFIFDGSKEDLINLDRFNKFKPLIGDGSYHSVKVYSYKEKEEEKEYV